MNVRPATPDDAREVARVHARAWRTGYRGLPPDEYLDGLSVEPTDEAVSGWRDRIAADRNRLLVAASDDEVVGYANVRLEETKAFVGDGEAELKELYVSPDRWGDGVGSALLAAAIESLPDDVGVLRLEALAGNDRAAGFYEARGFDRTGERSVDLDGSRYPTWIFRRRLV